MYTNGNSVPVSMDLKALITRLLEKDPIQRITIESIRCHPWFTSFDGIVPTTVQNCSNSIDISETDIMGAFQHHQTPIHILASYNNIDDHMKIINIYSLLI